MEVFCLEGSVAAGKSTLFNRLKDRYGSSVIFLGEPLFDSVKLGDSNYNPLRELYSENLRSDTFLTTQLTICQELFKYYETIDFTKSNIIIMDRCLASCLLFHALGYSQGLLSSFSRDFLKVFTLDLQKRFNDLLGSHTVHKYFIDTPVTRCVEQIVRRGRESELLCPINFWFNFTRNFRWIALRDVKFDMIAGAGEIEKDICRRIDSLLMREREGPTGEKNPVA